MITRNRTNWLQPPDLPPYRPCDTPIVFVVDKHCPHNWSVITESCSKNKPNIISATTFRSWMKLLANKKGNPYLRLALQAPKGKQLTRGMSGTGCIYMFCCHLIQWRLSYDIRYNLNTWCIIEIGLFSKYLLPTVLNKFNLTLIWW